MVLIFFIFHPRHIFLVYHYGMTVKKFICSALLAAAVLFTAVPVPVYAEITTDISNAASSSSKATADSLTSDYAFAYDYETDQVLLDKKSEEKIYPASTTKMLTLLTALDNGAVLTDTVTITEDMLAGLAEENASVVGYTAGETLTIQDLFYGAIMPSGADACNAIAVHIGGTIDGFVEMMNEEAASIGMVNSHFMNPTGLHDNDHYTTCRDLALLLETGLKNPTFKSIISAVSYTDSLGNSLINGVRSHIQNYPEDAIIGLQGCKSGYTDEAGHTLASYEKIGDMNVIIVTAHAASGILDPQHIKDTAKIASYINSTWIRKDVIEAGDEMGTYTADEIIGERTDTVTASETLSLDVPKSAEITIQADLPDSVTVTSEDKTETYDITVCADSKILYTTEDSYTVKKAEDKLNRFLSLAYYHVWKPVSSFVQSAFSFLKELF